MTQVRSAPNTLGKAWLRWHLRPPPRVLTVGFNGWVNHNAHLLQKIDWRKYAAGLGAGVLGLGDLDVGRTFFQDFRRYIRRGKQEGW